MVEYTLLAAIFPFVIVDPRAAVPVFLAITPNDTADPRFRMARLTGCATTGFLLLFSVAIQFMLNAITSVGLKLFMLPPT